MTRRAAVASNISYSIERPNVNTSQSKRGFLLSSLAPDRRVPFVEVEHPQHAPSRYIEQIRLPKTGLPLGCGSKEWYRAWNPEISTQKAYRLRLRNYFLEKKVRRLGGSFACQLYGEQFPWLAKLAYYDSGYYTCSLRNRETLNSWITRALLQ